MLPSGALLIDKPEGLTSSQVVSKIKWALINSGYAEKGFKIGHGGTLDPFAVGTLIVFLGEGTKLADTYLHSVKSYDGMISLGTSTNTGDVTGEVSGTSAIPELSELQWQELATTFVTGPYQQIPSMFSAKKRDGTPLYELARAGIEIEREPILKKIYSYQIQTSKKSSHSEFAGMGFSELSFSVQCESGTYVRVLAEDLAKKAGTLAHLKTLRRIQSSDAKITDCLPLADTIARLETQIPIEELKNYRSLAHLALHIVELPISRESANLLWKGIEREGIRLCEDCEKTASDQAYIVARLNQVPVALFEKMKDSHGFRLQRIFNQARLGG